MFSILCILLFLSIFISLSSHEQFLMNISGEVGKENFSYYIGTYEGTILLELTSVIGDSDLYISQYTLKPSYEPHLNSLQSVTCGVDSVIIPRSFKRPIGIGVFGHPSHELSTFYLQFYRIEDSLDLFNYNPYSDPLNSDDELKVLTHSKFNKNDVEDSEEEGESFFWIVLKTLLTCLIEIVF